MCRALVIGPASENLHNRRRGPFVSLAHLSSFVRDSERRVADRVGQTPPRISSTPSWCPGRSPGYNSRSPDDRPRHPGRVRSRACRSCSHRTRTRRAALLLGLHVAVNVSSVQVGMQVAEANQRHHCQAHEKRCSRESSSLIPQRPDALPPDSTGAVPPGTNQWSGPICWQETDENHPGDQAQSAAVQVRH